MRTPLPEEAAALPSLPVTRVRSRRILKVDRHDAFIFLFALPALVLYGVYLLYPVAASVWYSLLQWNGVGAAKFIGLSNWQELIQDTSVLGSLRNTLIILVSSVVVEIPIGLGLALLLQRLGRLATVLSSIYVVPLLFSSVAIGITFAFLYNPQFGPLYTIYNNLGRQAPAILGDPTTAIWGVAVVIVWQFIPLYMLLFNAGLTGIPHEYYEAARIDGAGAWHSFWNITIPLLRRTFVTSLVLIITGSLVYFDLIFVMTGGGPGNSSYTLALYIYREAFQNQNVGYGSAIAVFLFALSFVISGLIVRFSRILQES